MRHGKRYAAAIGIGFALAWGGCRTEPRSASGTAGDDQLREELPATVSRNRLRGVLIGTPQPRPDFVLTTVDGRPYDFRQETSGRLTLLFFGYTNCPDVCPTHVANIGRVLKELPVEVVRQVSLVFVTTDPDRDTPDRLREWLAGFHPDFIGLTGTAEEIRQAETAANLMPAVKQVPDSTNPSRYFVGHAAQVIAYTSDDLAHILYPDGIRQQDWANDLPILAGGWPEDSASGKQ